MDYKHVKVHKGVFDPSIKIKVVEDMREIKTAQDLRDVLHAPAELLEAFRKNRDQHVQAGQMKKRPQAIFEFVKLMYSEYPELSGSQIFRRVKRRYIEQNPYQIGNFNIYWHDNRLWQDDGINQPKSISYSTYQNYLSEIRNK